MRKSVRVTTWAVYQASVLGQPGPNVVCSQGEWEAIDQAQPGLHRLVRGGIRNEGEAERLARGASGDDKRAPRKKATLEPQIAEPARVESDEGESDGEGQEDDAPIMLPFSALAPEMSELAGPDEPPD